MKIWEKRFERRPIIQLIEDFNASIDQDYFFWEEEIKVSQAYARGLFKAGLISSEELDLIEKGLEKIKQRFINGGELSRFEDIHSAVELLLIEEIGQAGKN